MVDNKVFTAAQNMDYALLDSYAWQRAKDAELSAVAARTERNAREVCEGLEKAAGCHGYWLH